MEYTDDSIKQRLSTLDKYLDEASGAAKQIDMKPTPDIDRLEEFGALVTPLIKWLEANYHPHTSILIEYGEATLMEGRLGFTLVKDDAPEEPKE